jgi:hypothetical protein
MNTNKHTTGPWGVDGNAIVASKPFRAELEGGYPDTVCEMNSSVYPESTTANAALISAAPELLDALEHLASEAWQLRKGNVKKDYHLLVAHNAAIKAIRKARGEV